MNRTEDQIKQYFDEYIFGFIFNDIENCIKARANYTTALALLSYTDYLGGLINGTLGLQGESKKQCNRALEYFEWNGDSTYYQNLKIKFRDIDFVEKEGGDIYTLFRCGLAHEYFIQGDSLVHNNPEGYSDGNGHFYPEGCINSDVGIQIIEEEKIKRLRFHTNAYFRDFKRAWKKYFEKLNKDKNPELLRKFNNSLDRIEVREILF